MATKGEAHASQSEYFETESSVDSEVSNPPQLPRFFSRLRRVTITALKEGGLLLGGVLVPRSF
jgi:hypothetical protein